eukprot:5717986-Alexandrium_andersonii.AAC.1
MFSELPDTVAVISVGVAVPQAPAVQCGLPWLRPRLRLRAVGVGSSSTEPQRRPGKAARTISA